MPLEVCDFVLAEKAFDSLSKGSDDSIFIILSLIPVEPDIASFNAELLKLMVEFVILVRNIEKSFGGDTAHIETSASQRSSTLDASSLESKLRCLDGCDVA